MILLYNSVYKSRSNIRFMQAVALSSSDAHRRILHFVLRLLYQVVAFECNDLPSLQTIILNETSDS